MKKFERRIAAREFIARINAATSCARCKKKTRIEWHNSTHREGRENFRISNMVANGKPIPEIDVELRDCTPLCCSCHRREHAPRRLRKTGTCKRCFTDSPKLIKELCVSCYGKTYRRDYNKTYLQARRERFKEAEKKVVGVIR